MSRKHVGLLLLSAFCIVAITMNVILFRAGTIGDTKSGSFGDPVRALAVEDYALYMLIPAAALLGSSVYFLLGGSSRVRAFYAVVTTLLSLVVLWISGCVVEGWGVDSSF